MGQKVAILGASHKPDRFAYKAFKLLISYGHEPLLVNPHSLQNEIEGYPVYTSLADLPEKFDTLTMYVGPAISTQIKEEIVAAKAPRVIFNPGTENPELEVELKQSGSKVLEKCTLVMLRANEF